MSSRRFVAASALVVSSLFTLGGSCGVNLGPPAEAILAGAWKITAQDPVQNNRTFVFGESGRLSEIRTMIGPTTLIERNVHDTTRVTGQSVFVKTSGNLIFEGTLNDAADTITGALRTEVAIPFTSNTLITELGPATLNRT